MDEMPTSEAALAPLSIGHVPLSQQAITHQAPATGQTEAYQELLRHLRHLVDTPSDINEHLYTLLDYAKRCRSIAELGVAEGVSTAALVAGLAAGSSSGKTLFCADIAPCGHVPALQLAPRIGIDARFVQANSATLQLPEVDLLFIDTWHCYGHLRRELTRHHPQVRRWIILHDTEIDGYVGEPVRLRQDLIALRNASGYSIDDLYCGLGQAVQEFLQVNPAWTLEQIFRHNNGLTVLRRSDA